MVQITMLLQELDFNQILFGLKIRDATESNIFDDVHMNAGDN